ncbi:MAG TPA: cellulose biosynthesis protein BcsS [Vicinamibacteria bacterium]|nr:cellulose biosynthesis protein BcsS [Vicinamibacteria bacterium]
MRNHSVLRGAVAAAAFVAISAAAFAQQAPGTDDAVPPAADGREEAAGTVVAQADTRTTPGVVIETPRSDRALPRWDLSGGYEGDSNDTSYGYFGPSYHRPIRDNLALRLSLRANHLHYEFANGEGGRTAVGGPGISPAVGLRFGGRNWVQASVGLSIRDEQREVFGPVGLIREEDDTRFGLGLGADGWWNTSRRSSIHAMVHYGAVSNYTWARVAGRHQVTNFSWRAPVTFYLGAEMVGQGNEDIRSFQVGPVVEMALGRTPLSFSVRGGYKRSTFQIGEAESGPYFGVGLWKRF